MSIAFNTVPTANRRPDTFAEIDGSRALSRQPGRIHRVLLIGLKLATGSAVANVIVPIAGLLSGDALFGINSQLAALCYYFKRINPRAQVYALPLSEDEQGVAAVATIVLGGAVTKDGSLKVRVGRSRVSVAVKVGDTIATIGAALAAAINATPRIPFQASFAVATLTLTARHKGLIGNQVIVFTEATPAGITATDTQPANGDTNPGLATPIAGIDGSLYDTIVTGISDATNMGLLEAEAARRWGSTIKKPVHLFAAVPGSFGDLQTYGNARNSEHSTVMGTGLSPTEPWIWAVQVAARDAEQTDVLANRPRKGLTLPDCEAPPPGYELDENERNSLLYDGISTYDVDPSGRVLIERLITTYQVDAAGNADASFLAVETMRNLAGLLLDFVALGSKHDRSLLGPDDTKASAGVPMVTPKRLRGEVLALYRARERGGRVKDFDGFASDLLIELHEDDVERIDCEAHPRLVNGAVTKAFKLAFQL